MDTQESKLPPGLPLRTTPTKPKKPRGLLSRFLGRGLAVLLPTLLTLIILLWAYNILDTYVAEPLNKVMQHAIAPFVDQNTLEPYRGSLPLEKRLTAKKADLLAAYWDAHWLGWTGMVLALILVFIVGLLTGSFLGRTGWRVIERMLQRVPGIKQVYPYVKQVTDFVLNERPLEYSRVVMVEYPRKGCWSLGLVTGLGLDEMNRMTGTEMLAVFIPSSPTPVTGYVIQVPRSDVYDVNLTVDQALRFTISGGVVQPPRMADGSSRPAPVLGDASARP
ncbi:MAG: hypothetical protein BIFFINMI_03246 [Phycisphaerae bacterium]|nr:hypothetical protein [Phycisphaerae bacterium]